jgi:hypothetical protein
MVFSNLFTWEILMFTSCFIFVTMACVVLYFACRRLIDLFDGFVKVRLK